MNGLTEIIATLLSVLFPVLFLVFVYRKKNKMLVMPRGPVGLPLVGYLPFLGKYPQCTFYDLSKKYGSIISLNLGRRTYVILNKYDVINEALVKNGSIFSGRNQKEIHHQFNLGLGIINADYTATLRNLKRFGILTLKGFGVGKQSLEDRVTEEIRYFSEVIVSKGEKAIDVHDILGHAVSNITCNIVTGRRFEYNDESFKKMIFYVNQRFNNDGNSKRISLISFFPPLRYFFSFKRAFQVVIDQVNYTKGMFDKIIKDHESTYDKNHIRDFIDAYLKEMNNDEKKEHFTRENLDVYIRDLFNAGTETTTTTLRWCLLYLAHYPEAWDRLAKEIDVVSGEHGAISMSHRAKMPLVCSFLHEIQRLKPIVPLTPHNTTKDIDFHGYRIPKDTNVLINLWAVHHDPEIFENPEEFRPERFLDEEGKFFKHDRVIPYSIGPRYCLGMHLAEMELFVFLVGIIRNFKVVRDPETPLPPFDRGSAGLIYSPLPFKVSFICR